MLIKNEWSQESSTTDDESIACCHSSPCENRKLLSDPDDDHLSSLTLKGLFLRVLVVLSFFGLVYLFFNESNKSGEQSIDQIVEPVNTSRALSIINDLCSAVYSGEYTGDICDRLCAPQNGSSSYEIIDVYDGQHKTILKFRENGKDFVLKMSHPDHNRYAKLHNIDKMEDEEFTDAVLSIVNNHTYLGWPIKWKHHLMRRLLPHYDRRQRLSRAEKNTLWALLQQQEYINLSILQLSRVVPKINGICGHVFRPEYLIPFKMKPYYMSLKAKILIHLEGTLKLFDEFLNEPLQWCDVKFENLGLSADYPKRFVVMDSRMLFTESKLNAIFETTRCKSDTDCILQDCKAECTKEGFCSRRRNDNIEVFCQKLISQLFPNFWSKTNKYLAVCAPAAAANATKRLDELRLVWSWTLSDV